jgi:hypothetical protein
MLTFTTTTEDLHAHLFLKQHTASHELIQGAAQAPDIMRLSHPSVSPSVVLLMATVLTASMEQQHLWAAEKLCPPVALCKAGTL